MPIRFKFAHLAVLAGCILGCALVRAESIERKIGKKASDSVLEVLRSDGHYKIFLRALEYAELSEIIHEQGPYTIFAPTDEAFLKCERKDDLLKDKTALAAVLKCHLVPFSRIDAKNLAPLKLAMPLSSEQLDFSEGDGKIKINEASVVQSDLKARDGTAHGIDGVLLPKDFAEKFPRQEMAKSEAKSDGTGVFNELKPAATLIQK